MSAHADAGEIVRGLSDVSHPPALTHLVHGEPVALRALQKRIQTERGWPVHLPKCLDRLELDRQRR